MKIEDLLVKKNWERRVVRQTTLNRGHASPLIPNQKAPFEFDQGNKRVMTQSDFLDELHPESHIIYNVNWRSNRPKYKWDEVKKKNVRDGFDEVERVAVAFQESIRRKKAVCTFGNEVWFGNESGEDNTDELALFKSHWGTTNMQSALIKCAMSFYGTGDGAAYIYREGNEIRYKTFSFEDGDVFATAIDRKTGKEIGVRMFMYGTSQAVEIYGDTTVDLWVKDLDQNRIKEIWNNIIGNISDDGYTLVSKTPHGLTQSPFAYHRERDVPWGKAQKTIEHVESTLSDLSENNRYYAFQILFMRGGAVELPASKWQGKALAGKSETSDAKILQPANCSDSFTLDLDKSIGFIYESTSTTEVKPEQLKGGDYSGAYLRNLYFRDVQWSTEAIARLDPFMKKLISVFKDYVGLIEGKTLEYGNLRISYRITPFLPQNEMEEVTIINACVNSGTMSTKTATEELPRSNPREFERIQEEEVMLAETKAKAAEKAVDNVTNEAKNK